MNAYPSYLKLSWPWKCGHCLHGLLLLFTSTSCQTTTFKVVSAILSNDILKKRSVIWPLPLTVLKPNWCRSPILPSDWLDHFVVNVCFVKAYVDSNGPTGAWVFHFPLMRKPTNTPWGKICKLLGFFICNKLLIQSLHTMIIIPVCSASSLGM